jgi:hypothetical protein
MRESRESGSFSGCRATAVALQQIASAKRRNGSIATELCYPQHVRSSPNRCRESRHRRSTLRATSRHQGLASLGRCRFLIGPIFDCSASHGRHRAQLRPIIVGSLVVHAAFAESLCACWSAAGSSAAIMLSVRAMTSRENTPTSR